MPENWIVTSDSAGQVWSGWATGTTGSATSDIWVTWSGDAGTTTGSETTSGSSNEIWVTWTGVSAGDSLNFEVYDPRQEPAVETDEEIEARAERQRQHQIDLEAARKAKEVAREKAEVLLKENLDREQREQFDKTRWFYLISQSGKRYRIRHDWIGNIDEIDEKDMVVAGYCIHPQIEVPIEDSMLIQKLMLEGDEQRFLAIANKDTYREPRPLAV